MSLRVILPPLLCAALAACQPAVPDSAAGVVDRGTGVGFETSATAQLERDSALSSSTLPPPEPVDTVAIDTPTFPAPLPPRRPLGGASAATPTPADATASAAAAAANSGVAPVEASPSNAPPPLLNNPGISDEQDFDAVASRESIESDAARIAANKEQYQQVQPTNLPNRAGSGQVNIVQYALQTSHPRGQRIYRRIGLNTQAKFQRNCAVYASPDLAQIDFLEMGGPKRDRKGLDPDGDGYACTWDPAPFRRAASN